jgi:hypothetical protein
MKRNSSELFGDGAPRRRTWLAGAATIAAVLLLLVGLPQLFRGGALVGFGADPTAGPSTSASPSDIETPGPTSSTTPAPSPFASASASPDVSVRLALTTTLRTSSIGPWVVKPYLVAATYQLARIIQPGLPKSYGQVAVYEAGAYDPSQVQSGLPTEVRGHPARYQPAGTQPGTESAHSSDGPIIEPLLAWEYAPSAWAIVSGTFFLGAGQSAPTNAVPAGLLQLAEGVEIGEPQPVRLPFKLGFVPAGLAPVRVILGGPNDLNCVLAFGPANGSGPDQRNSTASWYDALMVGMSGPLPLGSFSSVPFAGHNAVLNGNQYEINLNGFAITVGSGQFGTRLLQAEVEQVFAGLTFADWNDSSTWFSIQ